MDTSLKTTWWKKVYLNLVKGEKVVGALWLLLIRLYWGWMLVLTGLGKWLHIEKVTAFFTDLHIPFPTFNAYFVGFIEFTGGISLILGLFSRLWSVLLIGVFLTAYATSEGGLLSAFTNPALFISKDPFLFLFTALIVLGFGPGPFSIDYWLEKRAFGKPL